MTRAAPSHDAAQKATKRPRSDEVAKNDHEPMSDHSERSGAILRVVIPMAPPPETSPNYHGDWRGRHRAVIQFREATAWAFRQQHPVFPVLQPPIAYRVVIRWGKGRKLHDDDNALAMTKAVRDQMAFDLDLRSDRQMRCVGVRQERDTAGNGETIFEGWSDAGGADNRDNPHDPGGAVDAEPTAPSGRSCPDHQ